MAEFTPIESQEQLNEVIKDRIARERAKFADYEDLKSKVSGYEQQIGELTAAAETTGAKLTDYEKQLAERDATIQAQATAALKTGIALQCGVPYELAQRLTGSTEEELRADAEKLAAMLRPTQAQQPLRNPEATQPEDGVTAAFRKRNPNIKI